jgi:S1-C subfamily serine protease
MLEDMNAPDEVATTGHGRRGLLLHIVAIGIALLALLLAVGAVVLETVDGDESTAPPLPNEATKTETVPLAANRKYTGPEDLPGLVSDTADSVVWIVCDEGSGTGWIINTSAEPNIRGDRSRDFDAGSSALVVTAEHVISDCIKNPDALEVFVGYGRVDASVLNWHRKRDVAVLAVNTSRPGLETTVAVPEASWAMSVGYPLEFENPIPVVGRVIAEQGGDLFLDMAIQPGNSGSPVVNHRGQVMGTAVATLEDKDIDMSLGWTVSVSTEILCMKLFECSGASITLTK